MENPNFYAIIPANIRYDNDLIPGAKLLYGEITALANKEGYCYATNSYFANLYSTHPKTISKWIQSLVSKGYIRSELTYKKGTNQIEERKLYISTPRSKNAPTYGQKDGDPRSENIPNPRSENATENNTIINNTINNNIPVLGREAKLNQNCESIINYLNQKTGKHFRPGVARNKNFIKARLNEGFKVEDFYKVIDTKCKEWLKDSEFSKYLCPETLFGNKFEKYLNQSNLMPQFKYAQNNAAVWKPTQEDIKAHEILKGGAL